MGGRELKEDVKKLQQMTGATYNQCLQAFVFSKHDFNKAKEFLTWMNSYCLFSDNEQTN